ncbi:MAG: T9SS type A sorting domain-containing protein, partial [Calditrichaeota bacterium]|nr:T9SS type A sorting domain-containing protein [Calditrichota bacterium]
IIYTLPHHSKVALTIYDLLGRSVDVLLKDKTQSPGRYSISWSASSFPAGVYFVRMEAGSFVTVRKLLLVR